MKKEIKVLLVEDDSNLGSITSDYLNAKGYDCSWEINGELGYREFVKNQYDIVILDVMMPIKDGFSTAKDIRGIDKEVPIIFLTAKSMKEDTLKNYFSEKTWAKIYGFLGSFKLVTEGWCGSHYYCILKKSDSKPKFQINNLQENEQ